MLKAPQVLPTQCIAQPKKRLRPGLQSLAVGALVASCLGHAGSVWADTQRGWSATYSGDLNGTVSGTIIVPGGTSMVAMLQGRSMSADMGSMGKAALAMQAMTLPNQPPTLQKLDITLADGTACRLKPDGSETVELRDTKRKSYEARMSGTLDCAGKTIRAEVWAKK